MDSQLDALTAAAVSTGGLFYGTQAGASRKFTLTAVGAALLEAATEADQRTALGLVLGTDVQAWAATLDTLSSKSVSGTGDIVCGISPTLVTPILGTPTSGTLTNCTGLPVSTGISGLGSGVATFLATPSSANLAAAVTDETGSGALVFGTSPTISGGVITGLTDFGVSMANNTAMTGFALGTDSDTTARPFVISKTWNNASLAGSILRLDVTSTNAAAASKYLEVTHDGNPYFSIRKGEYNDPAFYFRRVGTSVDDFIYVGAGNLTFSSQGTKIFSITGSTGVQLSSTSAYTWTSTNSESGPDLLMRRAAAATLQLGSDHPTGATKQTLKAHNVTAGIGATLCLAGGTGSSAGGAVEIATSTTTGAPTVRMTVKANGNINMTLPTSSAGLASGDLWSNSGVVTVA